MRVEMLVAAFVIGAFVGASITRVLPTSDPLPAVLPAAGILSGWQVVRDDETLICESPAIFVAARQIECP